MIYGPYAVGVVPADVASGFAAVNELFARQIAAHHSRHEEVEALGQRPSLSFRELCGTVLRHLGSTTSSQIELLKEVEQACAARRLELEESVPAPKKRGKTKGRTVEPRPLANSDIVGRTVRWLGLEALVRCRRVARTWNHEVAKLRVSHAHDGVEAILEGYTLNARQRLLGLVVLLRHGDEHVQEAAAVRLDRQTDGFWSYRNCLTMSSILGELEEDEEESGGMFDEDPIFDDDDEPQRRNPSMEMYDSICRAGVLPLLRRVLADGNLAARDAAVSTLDHLAGDDKCARRVAEQVLDDTVLADVVDRLRAADSFAPAARLLCNCSTRLEAMDIDWIHQVVPAAVARLEDDTAAPVSPAFLTLRARRSNRFAAFKLVSHIIQTQPDALNACLPACGPLVRAMPLLPEAFYCVSTISDHDRAGPSALVEAGAVPRLCEMLDAHNEGVRLSALEKQKVASVLDTVVTYAREGPAAFANAPLEPLVRLLQKTNAKTKDIITHTFAHVSETHPRCLWDAGAAHVLKHLHGPPQVLANAKTALANIKEACGSGNDSKRGHSIPIALSQVNPKRPGSASHQRYEAYKVATTKAHFLQLGGTTADYRNDKKAGFLVEHPPLHLA